MAPTGSDVRRSRGRPRNPAAESRILDAALEEYADRGWAGFTMDGVARRARVGKSTVYLRWQDKDALLVDAVEARTGAIEDVDTGSLRGDLEALVGILFRHYLDPGGWATLRLAVDAAAAPSPLATFSEKVAERHLLAVKPLLHRARRRGELDHDDATDELVLCLYGSVTMQTLMLSGARRALTDDDVAARAARLVRFVLSGATATGSG